MESGRVWLEEGREFSRVHCRRVHLPKSSHCLHKSWISVIWEISCNSWRATGSTWKLRTVDVAVPWQESSYVASEPHGTYQVIKCLPFYRRADVALFSSAVFPFKALSLTLVCKEAAADQKNFVPGSNSKPNQPLLIILDKSS